MLASEVINLVLETDLESDLGLSFLNTQVKDIIRTDVTEQLQVGLDASFSLHASNWRKVLVTLTGVVEIATEPVSLIGSLGVKVPAIEGTIEVEQPYILTLQEDGSFTWERVEDELTISIDLDTVE